MSTSPRQRCDINGFRFSISDEDIERIVEPIANVAKSVAVPQDDGRISIVNQSTSLFSQEVANPNLGMAQITEFVLAGQARQFSHSLGEPSLATQLPFHRTPHLYDFVSNNRIGLVETYSYPPKLCAELVTTFPSKTFAIMTPSRAKAGAIKDEIYSVSPNESVSCSDSSRPPAWDTRVSIGTYIAMAHNSVEFSKRDVLLIPHAETALSQRGLLSLSAMDLRGRLIGFVSPHKLLTESQKTRLNSIFGFHRETVPSYGLRGVNVRTELIKFRDSKPNGNDAHVKRVGVIRNSKRNRIVAKKAKSLFRNGNRVLVLTESFEHASRLVRFLPDWSTFLNQESNSIPFSQRVSNRLEVNRAFPDGRRTISTIGSIFAIQSLKFDVVVWATSGPGAIELPNSLLTAPSDTKRHLTVVDFDDRHHPLLRRWTRNRRDEYCQRGWFDISWERSPDACRKRLFIMKQLEANHDQS